MGNYNQDIIVDEFKEFFNKIKVRDIHQSYNLKPEKSLDGIYIGGSKYINSIVATQSLLDFIERSKLLEANEVTITDHRVFLIDINLEGYFKETLSI